MTWREDKRLIILCVFTVFFTMLALFVALKTPDDGTLFQFYANWAGGFAGGLLTCLLPDKLHPPPGSTTTTMATVQQKTETPQEPPAV